MVLALSHGLVSKEPDWDSFRVQAEMAYIQWSQENENGNRKKFLDSRLLNAGKPKTRAEMRKAIFWISLYYEWNEDVPEYVKKEFAQYHGQIPDEKATLDDAMDILLNKEVKVAKE